MCRACVLRTARSAGILLLTGVAWHAAGGVARAQDAGTAGAMCVSDSTLRDVPVRRVTVESRGSWRPGVQLPFGPGDRFDLQKLSEAHRVVSRAFNADPLLEAFELSGRDHLSVFFVSSCVTVHTVPECAGAGPDASPPRCVDVAIRPISIRLDMSNPAANAVSLPRSNRATFYSQVPAVVRTIDPQFGVSYDRRTGTSESARVSADLLAIPALIAGRLPDDRPATLDLNLRGSTSLDKPYYDVSSELRFDRVWTGKLVERLSLFGGASADHQPLGAARHFANGTRAGAALTLRPGPAGIRRLVVDGAYRRTAQRLFDPTRADDLRTDEHAFDTRVVLDGRIGEGTWRLGGWHEVGAPLDDRFQGYTRAAALGGYQTELGATEQTVGLEVLAGAGWASRAVPAYARFYPGAASGQFLHDDVDLHSMRAFPVGPVIRSLGRAHASAAVPPAGRSHGYWHVNVNLVFPLPRFSCPLIPAIPLFDEEAQGGSADFCANRRPAPGVRTLKDALVGMARTGESLLAADIAEDLIEGQTDPETAEAEGERRAAAVFASIRPAMRFLAGKANLYAVKPMFLLDAGASVGDAAQDEVRVAVGGGVQVTVAVARLELGYMRGVRRAASDPGGSLIARFVLVNLF